MSISSINRFQPKFAAIVLRDENDSNDTKPEAPVSDRWLRVYDDAAKTGIRELIERGTGDMTVYGTVYGGGRYNHGHNLSEILRKKDREGASALVEGIKNLIEKITDGELAGKVNTSEPHPWYPGRFRTAQVDFTANGAAVREKLTQTLRTVVEKSGHSPTELGIA